ncbi:30S ribosomal protein S7 [Akkermansiaceae bacterium]|nr:30S ribosomal protein S7 [Akkermansiaceae bacterium]
MARRKRVYPAKVYKDPKFDSQVVGRLISKVMKDGKRSLAERIVYAAIDRANEGTDTIDPLEIVNRAIENAKPRVEVKSRRVGGATYQVPLEVDSSRSESLGMRWIITFSATTLPSMPSSKKTIPTKSFGQPIALWSKNSARGPSTFTSLKTMAL